MKIEIDTDEWGGIPILIKPTIKGYASNRDYSSWEISDIQIEFERGASEEQNKDYAKKLCNLLMELCWIDDDSIEFRKNIFDWIREALREKFGLVGPEIDF
jgi:hypothetical protein